MTHDEIIAVVQAHKEGKVIESKFKDNPLSNWIATHPVFNFGGFDYRVKPEPTLREWKPEEVPLDAWFKETNSEQVYYKITRIDLHADQQFELGASDCWVSTEELFNEHKHSFTPFDANSWKECGVRE